MALFFRIMVLGALCWLAYVLLGEVRQASSGDVGDPTHVILLFGGIIVVALGIAAIVGLWIVPAIGERLVCAVYNPGEEVQRDPHSAALAKKASGEWEEAVEEYRKCYRRDPEDSIALNEMVHLYADKLHDPASAAVLLEAELEKEWPQDHAAFLATRLVDIYWNHQQDAVRARQILIQVAETMPDTSYAANAQHRLRDIDKALQDQPAALSLESTESSSTTEDPTRRT